LTTSDSGIYQDIMIGQYTPVPLALNRLEIHS
jgi:hypothetical protein